MHVEVVITCPELIELLCRQSYRGCPHTTADFGFCHWEYDRTGNTPSTKMNMGRGSVDVGGDNGGFHLICCAIDAHHACAGAIAGDRRDLFGTRQRAGEYILRYLAVDGADLADLRRSWADGIVVTAAARQHQQ